MTSVNSETARSQLDADAMPEETVRRHDGQTAVRSKQAGRKLISDWTATIIAILAGISVVMLVVWLAGG